MSNLRRSPEVAQALFERTIITLDEAVDDRVHSVQATLLDRDLSME